MNIVEQAISSLKGAIKADLSRPAEQESMDNRQEARRQASISPWRISSDAAGCLGQVNEIWTPSHTKNAPSGADSCEHTFHVV